jgi:hypothetical protein
MDTPQSESDSKDMPEPQDISLDEQAQLSPAPDIESQTEDFETKATLTGHFPV